MLISPALSQAFFGLVDGILNATAIVQGGKGTLIFLLSAPLPAASYIIVTENITRSIRTYYIQDTLLDAGGKGTKEEGALKGVKRPVELW